MGRDDAGGGSDLPAPYRNPWLALRDDVGAVLADARLRLRELWRRNGEGGLWRPGWWPRDLAPLFWPLVVGVGLAAVLALLGALLALLVKVLPVSSVGGGGPSTSVAPGASATVAPEAADRVADDARDERGEAGGDTSAEPVAPTSTGVVVPQDGDGGRSPEAEGPPALPDDGSEATPAGWPSPSASTSPSSSTPRGADPLELLLERPEAAGLIDAAAGEAQTATLTLQLSPAFKRLPARDQRRQADLWQGWARELGYDHLELRDQRAGLLGRDALVGDGMILLSPQPPT